MTQHNLLDAVKKLLPHAEAEQEALYKASLKYPGCRQEKLDYERINDRQRESHYFTTHLPKNQAFEEG